ncbi:MAG: YfhO family protein, partial [Cyclobacteriaceae bacterium]|nr:YfhO family protein [Cyclobacteriaceae bacterium]
ESNGVAWFPSSIQSVITNDDEISKVASMDTKTVATVNENEYGKQETGIGSVELSERKPNEMTYTVEAEKGGLVVFSEIYYPEGWKAYVNGAETPIIRTNYLLRGVQVPDGSSIVNMRFEPGSYYHTKTAVVLFQYLISILLVFAIAFTYYKDNQKP